MTYEDELRSTSNADLKGKTALVTGASRGIGYAIAARLAENGVNIAVNSSSADSLIRQLKTFCLWRERLCLPADLLILRHRLSDTGCSFTLKLDILINNAGIAIPKLLKIQAQRSGICICLECQNPFLLCREAIPHQNPIRHYH